MQKLDVVVARAVKHKAQIKEAAPWGEDFSGDVFLAAAYIYCMLPLDVTRKLEDIGVLAPNWMERVQSYYGEPVKAFADYLY
jgi:hypothetical protein